MTDRPVTVIDAPSNLGLRPPAAGRVPGVYRLAQTLTEQGIVSRLGATDGGGVTPPPYSPDVDLETGVLNGEPLRAYSLELADKVGPIVRDGPFPLVLGGDCGILVGGMLALRRLGRFGLVFIVGGRA